MCDAGMRPNVHTYATVISAYGKLGLWELAAQAFRTMREGGVEPNVVAYNALTDIHTGEVQLHRRR